MKSMTGFGQTEGRAGDVQLSVEIRSVNQRNLDVKVVAPREYGRWESELRRQVGACISRGRVELYVNRNAGRRLKEVVVQLDAAKAYARALRKLKKELDLGGEVDLSLLQSRGEIFQAVERVSDPSKEIAHVRKLVDKALAAHAKSRETEGRHLLRDMQARARALARIHRQLQRRAAGASRKLQQRLERRVGELLAGRNVDPARIVQETAILADRADVTEELVRLASHLEALSAMLADRGPVGKRIDFLLQEVHRELNTIGSKANDLAITNAVLEGKAEVEKLREQVQNVE
jgi:uncharacterized protein (TIGR00255 family)